MSRPVRTEATLQRAIAESHGGSLVLAALIVVGWCAAGVLARVGIPAVDPGIQTAARPLETLGFFALCFPISVTCGLLEDRICWLTNSSPRTALLLKSRWLAVVLGVALLGTGLWFGLLPGPARTSHSLANAGILLAIGVLAAAVVGSRLAAIGPISLTAIFSLGRPLPFEWNLIYNPALTNQAWFVAIAGLVIASAVFIARAER